MENLSEVTGDLALSAMGIVMKIVMILGSFCIESESVPSRFWASITEQENTTESGLHTVRQWFLLPCPSP